MISIIIPTINDPYLFRTLEDVYDHAEGDIEFIVINDGGKEIPPSPVNIQVVNFGRTMGRRYSINTAASLARGKWLFILDAHCSMSQGWDIKLSRVCDDKSIIVCAIHDMDPESWEIRPGPYHHVYLNNRYTEKWWHMAQKPLEAMMCFTGCAWLISKKFFFELGGYNEEYGKYGWDGPEWAMKAWLDGNGRVLLCSDVICGHVFGTNNNNTLYPVETIGVDKWYRLAEQRWGRHIHRLVKKFAPVPTWEEGEENMPEPKKHDDLEVVTHYHTVVNKVDTVVHRDLDERVVRIELIYYVPYTYTHDGSLTDDEVAERVKPHIKEVHYREDMPLTPENLRKYARIEPTTTSSTSTTSTTTTPPPPKEVTQ